MVWWFTQPFRKDLWCNYKGIARIHWFLWFFWAHSACVILGRLVLFFEISNYWQVTPAKIQKPSTHPIPSPQKLTFHTWKLLCPSITFQNHPFQGSLTSKTNIALPKNGWLAQMIPSFLGARPHGFSQAYGEAKEAFFKRKAQQEASFPNDGGFLETRVPVVVGELLLTLGRIVFTCLYFDFVFVWRCCWFEVGK